MHRVKCVIILAALLLASNAEARAQAAPQKQAAQAPAKARGARKAEVARLRKEFEDKLVAQETKAWEEEKNRNVEFFRRTMTEQFVAAETDGKRYTKADVLPLIPTVQISSFELTDFHVIRAGRDAAVVTYRAAVTAPEDGKESTKHFLAATVWVRRGAEWKMTFHQKTLAP